MEVFQEEPRQDLVVYLVEGGHLVPCLLLEAFSQLYQTDLVPQLQVQLSRRLLIWV